MTQDKSLIRQQLREILRGIPAQDRQRKSQAAGRFLTSSPEFQNAKVVMLYIAMASEVDTAPIALRAWQDSKTVVAPKVFMNDHTMLPIEIHSLESGMQKTRVGVLEPEVGQPIPLEFIDLVIVPGLGFGPAGQRIGRGGGFYDRFLANHAFAGRTCGLAFEEQVLSDLPMLSHDRPINMLVTDTRLRRFTSIP